MQEHVGKKRRKEVREAIDMRNELKSTLVVTAVALVIGIGVTVGVQILTVQGALAYDNVFVQLLPMIVIFVLLMVIGSRAYKWSGLREEYKEHCKKYNISKEDMRALERGDI